MGEAMFEVSDTIFMYFWAGIVYVGYPDLSDLYKGDYTDWGRTLVQDVKLLEKVYSRGLMKW